MVIDKNVLVGMAATDKAANSSPNQLTAIRHDSGKPRITILPGLAIEQVSKVGEMGALKYGDYNYRKGMKVSRFINPIWRHVFIEYFFKGNDVDPESGLHHLAHGAWNCLALLEQVLLGRAEFDDRQLPISSCSDNNITDNSNSPTLYENKP
jgi:Domain of unknown function (DUF5664)